jgi:hypothetical protein
VRRFRVVAFETVFPIWSDQVHPCGGGVAFLPIDEAADWPTVVAAIVQAHFHHPTVRSAEVGIATLDEAALAQFCQRHGTAFWQGGDIP